MKKIVALCCALALTLSLTACSSRPSDEKIKEALDQGTITVEDAISKGWIDDEWIQENFEQVEAKTKVYLFGDFETTYLDGTPVTSDIIHDTMCLVFFNTAGEETLNQLAVFQEAKEEMEKAGVPLLGIVTDTDLDAAKEKLADFDFPIIVYNDEMKEALSEFSGIIESDLTTNFTHSGGFYSAWYSETTVDDLVETARNFADME